MGEWKTYKLCEVANLSTGFPFDGHKYAKEGQRVVRGDNVTIGELRWDTDKDKRWNEPFARAEEFSLQEGDIVIGMDGSRVGRNRAQIKTDDLPLLLAQRVACVRHNEKSLQKFLYYQIFSKNFENYIKSVHTGTSIPHVSLKQIGDFSFQVPDLSTQRRIAGILGSLDDKIELNRRINANLEAQAQALFRSWFVDFEPFRDGPFVDSELGKIPQGWKVIKLDNIVNIYTGYSYKGNELQESNIGMATIKNFDRNGTFKVDGYKSIKPSIKLKQEQNITLFDIIVAHTDLTQNADIIGNPALVFSKGPYSNLIMSMDLSKVVSKQANINNFLLFCILKDIRFKNHILGYVNGTTVLHLSKKAIPEYKIALPTKDLDKISKIFESLYMKISNNYSENEKLTSLRDTLLPKLMAGEITIE